MPHLLHFSEDPTIRAFRPRPRPGLEGRPCVWAIDEAHAPLYWFPRDCPRITFWADEGTTAPDHERFLGLGTALRVHAIEAVWLDRVRACALHAYHFDAASFHRQPDAPGYFVSEAAVVPLGVEPVGDLLGRHAAAGIELRVTPSLGPLRDAVAASSLRFSMCRLRNPLADPGRPGADG